MEIFLERLLLELAVLALQLAILGIVRWLGNRPAAPTGLVDAG